MTFDCESASGMNCVRIMDRMSPLASQVRNSSPSEKTICPCWMRRRQSKLMVFLTDCVFTRGTFNAMSSNECGPLSDVYTTALLSLSLDSSKKVEIFMVNNYLFGGFFAKREMFSSGPSLSSNSCEVHS